MKFDTCYPIKIFIKIFDFGGCPNKYTGHVFFFLIDKHKYIKGHQATKHTGSIQSSLKQERKKQPHPPLSGR